MNSSLSATTQGKMRQGAKVEAKGMKIALVSYLMKKPWTFGNHFLVDS